MVRAQVQGKVRVRVRVAVLTSAQKDPEQSKFITEELPALGLGLGF